MTTSELRFWPQLKKILKKKFLKKKLVRKIVIQNVLLADSF